MNLQEYSIKTLHELYSKDKASPQEVINEFHKKAKKLNPNLNSYLSIIKKPTIDDSKKDKSLYGIPFGIKDSYMTKGVPSTAASKVLDGFAPSYNSTVYQKLLDAGAVLIGKTNCDAWGHGSSTEHSDFGVTKNPWNTRYVPGGSGGGDAAALSSHTCMFNIGEDTGGSIRLPANFCGVCGLKVTYGLVSRFGVAAFASSLDTVGPLAKNIEDLSTILEVIAGNDPLDATSTEHKNFSYLKHLNNDIRGLTVGLPEEYFGEGIEPEVRESVEDSIKVLEKIGVKFKKISLKYTKYGIGTYYVLATSETCSNLGRYDGIRYGNDRSNFGSEAKRRIILGTHALSSGYADAYYKKASKVRKLIKEDFMNVLSDVDMLLTPIAPFKPFKFGEKADDITQMYLSDIMTINVNLAGVPALALPSSVTKKENLPIGFQLIGKHYDEALLLNVGHKYEKAKGGFEKLDI